MGGDGRLEIVSVDEVGAEGLLVHDERREDPSLAFALSRLAQGPAQPTPFGVFRAVDRPVYGEAMEEQLRAAAAKQGPGDLARLLAGADTWTVG